MGNVRSYAGRKPRDKLCEDINLRKEVSNIYDLINKISWVAVICMTTVDQIMWSYWDSHSFGRSLRGWALVTSLALQAAVNAPAKQSQGQQAAIIFAMI